MVLAWPGVVVQFLLIALCAKYVFPYDWSWPEAFLFGAMMSATDPVAVVAVLQEVRLYWPDLASLSNGGKTAIYAEQVLALLDITNIWAPDDGAESAAGSAEFAVLVWVCHAAGWRVSEAGVCY